MCQYLDNALYLFSTQHAYQDFRRTSTCVVSPSLENAWDRWIVLVYLETYGLWYRFLNCFNRVVHIEESQTIITAYMNAY